MKRVMVIGAPIGIVVAAITAANAGSSAHVPAMTPAAQALATTVAHWEADGTTPAHPGTVLHDNGAWPANVTAVDITLTNRARTAAWVGLQKAEDNRAVVVIKMVGKFAVMTSGPNVTGKTEAPAQIARGTQEIIVADAKTGQVLDFGLDNGNVAMPHAIVVFSRA